MGLVDLVEGFAEKETIPRCTVQGTAFALGLPPIAYEVYGPEDAPAVVVLGGISASRHVAANELDDRPGWWEGTVGTRGAIDTDQFRVVGINWATSGRRAADDYPIDTTVTTFDQARAVCAVLDEIGIESAHAVVGASYGGMVALAFAARFPTRAQRIVVIGAAHESDPMTTTLRAIQRRIVSLGERAGAATEGVALARALAMTTYRTRTEFVGRFSNKPLSTDEGITFPAEEYVIARGRDYAGRTAPDDFRALTLSLDLHSVRPEDIKVPATLIAVLEDQLVSVEQIRELQRRIGGPATLIELSSVHGHDSFLNDSEQMSPFITTALGTQSVPLSKTFASLQ